MKLYTACERKKIHNDFWSTHPAMQINF